MPDLFDLTAPWSADPKRTAQILADTMRCVMDQSDPEPIREHYRNTRDPELRGAIAFLMGADR